MINAEKIFDLAAENYENTEEKRFKQYTIKTLDMTKKYLKAGDVVLDYGCATGTKAVELAGYVKKIYSIDISSKMIELAKRKAVQYKIKNVDFSKAAIFDERFKKGSFNVIMAFNILHLLEDSRKAVQRIIELLKPGGLFISTTPCLGEKMNFLTKLQFSFFLLLIKIGLFPVIKRFKFSEIENLIANENFQIAETEKTYNEMSAYFIVAKKL
jgi:2-polyprenyl-3-methyl-5-hydroxy-6-metoxy-1,4-benzoquinol methylase